MKTLPCDAILFDLDGVLVDSRVVVERHWRRWAERHGLDPGEAVRIAHGRRTVETVALLMPHLDAEEEAARIVAEEGKDTEGLEVMTGAARLLRSIPSGRWAVATSGTRVTAETRLKYAALPWPPVLITSDDVEQGKPHPEVYLRAARQLGAEPGQCIVVEDTPIGIQAAHAANMRAIAVTTTNTPDALTEADVVVEGMQALRVRPENGAAGSRLIFEMNGHVR